MKFENFRRQVIHTSHQVGSSVMREGRERIDPERVAAAQQALRTGAGRAAAAISPHLPDSQTLQQMVTGLSQQQLERVVHKSLGGMTPETRAELGRLAASYAREQPGFQAPRGLERGDPTAVAAVIAQALQNPRGVSQFATLVGAARQGGVVNMAALGQNPVARQFLGRLLANLSKSR